MKTGRKVSVMSILLISISIAGCSSGQAIEPTFTQMPTQLPATTSSIPLTQSPSEMLAKVVVIDTDMAPDDWIAILYLLQRKDVVVKAITISGTGEAHCQPGVNNALGLVALAGYPAIPVACGQETPLKGNHVFPESWREAADGLYGMSLPEVNNPNPINNAADLLTSIIQASPKKVNVLAIGPLTNLAEAIQKQPSLPENIEMVYIMGGAVDVRGNIADGVLDIDNRVAEWNIYIDPYAANIVFQSGVPITLVPLDATNDVLVNRKFYDDFNGKFQTRPATFVYDFFTNNPSFFEMGTLYFWDSSTAAILTDESLAKYKNLNLCVVEDEGSQSGQTKISDNCPVMRVAVSIEQTRFESLLINTLNGQ
jgi:inosine-uridine nucleoside N-ribohydrolase